MLPAFRYHGASDQCPSLTGIGAFRVLRFSEPLESHVKALGSMHSSVHFTPAHIGGHTQENMQAHGDTQSEH